MAARRRIVVDPMSQQLVYEIDDGDRIVALGRDWQPFAEANGGDTLQPDNVVGRRLFDFITDPTVRDVYRAIIAKARSGRPVRFRYRCDAPAWRREFEMVVAATAPNRVTFVSTLLQETARRPVPLFGTSPNAPRLVRMCSWCHGIASPTGEWRPLEVAIDALDLLAENRHAGVTHGICPECVERMFRVLNADN